MQIPCRPISFTIRLISLVLLLVNVTAGAVSSSPARIKPQLMRFASAANARAAESSNSENHGSYTWNIDDAQLPLLALPEHLAAGVERLLSYPLDQFRLPIFQALNYDAQHRMYLLPLISQANAAIHFVEFLPSADRNTFTSVDGTNIQLVDDDNLKIFRTINGTKYIFVRYPDGEFRCATIKQSNGASLNLNYAASGFTLHGVVDSFRRTLTFNYTDDGITSITQTWMANSEAVTKTWIVGNEAVDGPAKHSHAVGLVALK